MFSVLSVIATICAALIMPFAVFFGFIGFWIFGTVGAVIGVIIGFLLQGGYN